MTVFMGHLGGIAKLSAVKLVPQFRGVEVLLEPLVLRNLQLAAIAPGP